MRAGPHHAIDAADAPLRIAECGCAAEAGSEHAIWIARRAQRALGLGDGRIELQRADLFRDLLHAGDRGEVISIREDALKSRRPVGIRPPEAHGMNGDPG
jgi:hypothetical protein